MPLDNKEFIVTFDNNIDRKTMLKKQPWVILGNILTTHEVIEVNYMEEPDLCYILFLGDIRWTSSKLPPLADDT